MDVNDLLLKALNLDLVKNQQMPLTFSDVLKISLNVAVTVKTSGNLSKAENIDLLMKIVNGILDHLKQSDQVKSMTSKDWVNLQYLVDETLPVFYESSNHLEQEVVAVCIPWLCNLTSVVLEKKKEVDVDVAVAVAVAVDEEEEEPTKKVVVKAVKATTLLPEAV